MPTIGASGAIAAVMGAYFRLYPPRAHRDARPPFFFDHSLSCPPCCFWVVVHHAIFFSGTLSLVADPSQAGGIAWWAHIGGFIFGALQCSVIKVQHSTRRNHERHLTG